MINVMTGIMSYLDRSSSACHLRVIQGESNDAGGSAVKLVSDCVTHICSSNHLIAVGVERNSEWSHLG